MKQTLAEWTTELYANARKFNEYWYAQHDHIDTKSFPLEMSPGDWDEQFGFFVEDNERDDANAN